MLRPFNYSEGLAVQLEGLARWKRVLKPEVYILLEAACDKHNSKLCMWINRGEVPISQAGYEVFRGQDLTNWVLNVAMNLPD